GPGVKVCGWIPRLQVVSGAVACGTGRVGAVEVLAHLRDGMRGGAPLDQQLRFGGVVPRQARLPDALQQLLTSRRGVKPVKAGAACLEPDAAAGDPVPLERHRAGTVFGAAVCSSTPTTQAAP